MTSQHEWTSSIAEPESYPGVLRGYRHFAPGAFLKSVHSAFTYPQIEETEWWESHCGTGEYASPSTDHKSPVKECRCGFYVNYYPQTSFYTQENDGTYPRGVVEASGRIVLAQKGFRAQKLRLTALAPISFALGAYMQEVFPWVKLYADVDKMYADYPQEDLTSLIGEKAVSRNLNPSLWEELSRESIPSWYHTTSPTVTGPLHNPNDFSLYGYSASQSQYSSKSWLYRFPDGLEVLFKPSQDYVKIVMPLHVDPSYLDFVSMGKFDVVVNPTKTVELSLSNLLSYSIEEDMQGNLIRLVMFDNWWDYEFDFKQNTYSITKRKY